MEAPLLSIELTWDELRYGLVNARALDLAATRARSEVFDALNHYAETCVEPHPEAAYWRRLAAAKRERRARIQREREAEEAQLCVATERALEETRTRCLAEEAELQAVRARWEASRRDEEKATAELGLAEERPQPAQPKPPDQDASAIASCAGGRVLGYSASAPASLTIHRDQMHLPGANPGRASARGLGVGPRPPEECTFFFF